MLSSRLKSFEKLPGLGRRRCHLARVRLGQKPVEFVRPNVHAVSQRSLIYYQLMGDNGYVPLTQQFFGQATAAVHHYGYVVLLNQ